MNSARPSIVSATMNKGKYTELEAFFSQENIDLLPLWSFDGVGSPVETGLSFVENALIKARNAARLTGHPVIADDSGLVVPALGGAPGVISSRYAGDTATDKQNIDKLLSCLDGKHNRNAYFMCVLVFLRSADDPVPIVTQAMWEGKILSEPSGEFGFGYDPVFWVASHQCSAAALTTAEKASISHRGKALRLMLIEIQSIIRKGEICLHD